MNDEIRRIISGESQVRYGAIIQATIGYLTGSAQTGAMDKAEKHFKRQETERLKQYIELGIILEDLHDENVLTRNEILYFVDTVFYLKQA